jgi:NADH dehydrogenase/NADH:ubiquinone oxidoreductase subunit G
MLRVTINKQTHEFSEGLSILQALHAVGVDVPTLWIEKL